MLATRFLRLIPRRHNITRHAQFSTKTDVKTDNANKKHDPKDVLERLVEENRAKILFNTHLDHLKYKLGYRRSQIETYKQARFERKQTLQRQRLEPLPASLKYFVSEESLLKKPQDVEYIAEQQVFHLPFKAADVDYAEAKIDEAEHKGDIHETAHKRDIHDETEHKGDIKNAAQNWMTNYDTFDDSTLAKRERTKMDHEQDDTDEIPPWANMYGTPDPKEKISKIGCGGCGALLHCTDTSIPGYIPSELFKDRSKAQLQQTDCQRCHFMKEYDVALNVSVRADEYASLLKVIESKKALVILMVDLLDFPCSVWPDIVDIIGTNRPLIVVGNKVDLLPQDSSGYLRHIRQSLMDSINQTSLGKANIKDLHLISAKTGYGVEEFITRLFKIWLYRGDVYLIGCTNVGKSSLFNLLLQSDYCKVQAVDIIQRATVNRWPGTTLNLLKFPINRPSGWKLWTRNQRLKQAFKANKAEIELRKQQLTETRNPSYATLMGHIGRSFVDLERASDFTSSSYNSTSGFNESLPKIGINEKDKIFAQSKWFYDTPGVIHPDQILTMLTAEELLITLPKRLIRPKCFFLHSGNTILLGGIARLDFIECSYPVRFSVFCSDSLPITITTTEEADELYKTFLGTPILGVPCGNEERLKNWPGLKIHNEIIEFDGEGSRICCGDVVLSSAGWISATVPHTLKCKVAAWTPEAKGVYVRKPSLLRHAIMLKGKRMRDTPAYSVGPLYTD